MFTMGLVAGQLYAIIAAIVTFIIICKVNKVSRRDVREIADAIDTAVMFRDSRICVWRGNKLLSVVRLEEE